MLYGASTWLQKSKETCWGKGVRLEVPANCGTGWLLWFDSAVTIAGRELGECQQHLCCCLAWEAATEAVPNAGIPLCRANTLDMDTQTPESLVL